MTSAWKNGSNELDDRDPTNMKCLRCSRGSCPSAQRTQCVCLVSLGLTLAENVSNFSGGSTLFTRERLATQSCQPEKILTTPDSRMEMGPCNTESIGVSRILGTPEIPPRTIACHTCHTCCETLRRPPNWLPAARELTVRKCSKNGDQNVQDFLHN